MGISENAIKMQIWIALVLYLLLWKMYRERPHYCDKFIRFVGTFKQEYLYLIKQSDSANGKNHLRTYNLNSLKLKKNEYEPNTTADEELANISP